MTENLPVTLRIEKLGHQGDGLAPWKEEGGRTIRASVPFTLPGETVRATLHETPDHAHGTLVEILEPHAERQKPPCMHFGACGGCRLQHAPAGMIAALKCDQLKRALEHNGIVFTPVAIFTTPLHSRRRVTFHARHDKKGIAIGFHKRESHELVAITTCPVLRPSLEALLPFLYEVLQYLPQGKEADITLTELLGVREVAITGPAPTDEKRAALTSLASRQDIGRLLLRENENTEYELLFFSQRLMALYGPYELALPSAPFLQASDEAEAAMLDYMRPFMRGVRRYADLFCGTGLFALSFYEKGADVLAADADGPAITALLAGARGLPGLKAERRNLMRVPVTAQELKDRDVVIIDPPRAGAREQCLELAKLHARIIYVSCNPQSFARDARILQDGGLQLKDAKLFDQFLYSHHTEVIGVFER